MKRKKTEQIFSSTQSAETEEKEENRRNVHYGQRKSEDRDKELSQTYSCS